MDAKQKMRLSGGLASLVDSTPAPAADGGQPSPSVGAEAERATYGEEEDLLNSIEDEDLREALRAKRNLRRGRPRRGRPPIIRDGDLYERVTFVLRRDLHTKLREISLRETLTLKEVLNGLVEESLRRYEETHGEITPGGRGRRDASELFR